MNYSKFDDVSFLLIGLCRPFSREELAVLTEIGAKMADDADFGRAYTLEIKNFYLKNLPALHNGSYVPLSFSELNDQICERIKKKEKTQPVLLPEYASAAYFYKSKARLNVKKTEELKTRLLQLRQKNKG